MKSLIFALTLALPTSGVFAADQSCGKGVYCADEMVCVRTVNDPKPKGMHPDYFTSVVSMKTFKSTRKDGVLVDSLQINDDPSGPNAMTLQEAWSKAEFEYGNYGAPMRVSGKKVSLSWGPASNFSLGVKFVIVASSNQNGYRLDTLEGQEGTEGDVVGSYSATYICQAKVVDQLTRVIDLTK